MKKYIIFLLFTFCFYNLGYANDKNQDYQRQSSEYREKIKTIIDQDTFGKFEQETSWKIQSKNDKQNDQPKTDSNNSFDNLSDILVKIANIIEFLFWAIVFFLVFYLLYKYKTQLSSILNGLKKNETSEIVTPDTIFGIQVNQTKLPNDTVASARNLWNKGENRQSMAILLQASLIKLIHDHQCHFTNADTEQEFCDKIERQAPTNISQYMQELVRSWQKLAYAHEMPTEKEFETLCKKWQEVFA